MSLSCVHFGYAFDSSIERFQIGKGRANELKGRYWDFLIKVTEEVQARLPDNAAIFQAMTIISPKEIHTRQDVAQLADVLRMHQEM